MNAAVGKPSQVLEIVPAPARFDPECAVEIADGVWWVGHYLEDDPFQCHVYLIEAGDQSVLVDPGSALTFPNVLNKIEQVTKFSNIRYFICHHQDPDITGALPLIDQIVSRKDAVIVTHWRAEVLLRHYGHGLAFWRVDDHDWMLDVGNRRLRFVFTPYLHFPGAFCTFDEHTGVLLSSDLFGGFTEGFDLFAEDMSYFEAMRPFHEHYMPSREILAHGLARFDGLPITLIAPQHGRIIPERLVRPIIDRLKQLDCGLYLLARQECDIQRLMQLNEVLHGITETMARHRDFSAIAAELLRLSTKLIPATSLEFFALSADNEPGEILHLTAKDHYRGTLELQEPRLANWLGVDRETWDTGVDGKNHLLVDWPKEGPASEPVGHRAVIVPLFAPDSQIATALAVMHLGQEMVHQECIQAVIEQMVVPLQVAVERESVYRMLDLERRHVYERLIRDPLTGLFTRVYMQDTIARMLDLNDRDPSTSIGLLLIDIDHFKEVNDNHGHNAGDMVLKRVAETVLATIRRSDLPVRLGGEEFAVFCPGQSEAAISSVAERVRRQVGDLVFEPPVHKRRVTISIGTAVREKGETVVDVIGRADQALYAAKAAGRNQVASAATATRPAQVLLAAEV